ncbi:MAG TPA: phosphate ABC transporter permease subunit PstC [Thermomicrobiales bacterium]|nr:phosphate ABC transporter permease subunit PstC [Thermomicrobiales bacterium]
MQADTAVNDAARAGAPRLALGGRRAAPGDALFRGLAVACAAAVPALLAAIALVLLNDARGAFARFGLGFLSGQVWDPVQQVFGVLPYIYGTLVTSLLALLIATPLALAAALYVVEYAPPWLRAPVGFTVELLAAIPSIIFGLWGIFVLGPFLRDHVERPLKAVLGPAPGLDQLVQGPAIGRDFLVAGVILAIMILPTIMSVAREIIRAVPDAQREGLLALGATRWETIRGAVLPYARGGVVGAAILGLGRALGETMAVTMVIGNSSAQITPSLLTPGYTMASAIANQFNEADSPLYFSAIVGVALVLLLVAAAVNVLARLIVARVAGTAGAGGGPALG